MDCSIHTLVLVRKLSWKIWILTWVCVVSWGIVTCTVFYSKNSTIKTLRVACPCLPRGLHVLHFFWVIARQPGIPSPELFLAIEQVSADKQASQRSMGLTVRPCLVCLPPPAINTRRPATTSIATHIHPSLSIDQEINKVLCQLTC